MALRPRAGVRRARPMRAAASFVRARAQARREHSLVLFGCARRGAAAASPLAAEMEEGL
jgi:hypothetical protein